MRSLLNGFGRLGFAPRFTFDHVIIEKDRELWKCIKPLRYDKGDTPHDKRLGYHE